MREPEHYPQSFDEMVELVLAGQMAAASVMWDNTMIRMGEAIQEEQTGERD